MPGDFDLNRLKPFGQWVGVLVALQVLFLGGLVAAMSVPDGAIVTSLAADVESGAYPSSRLPDGMGGQGVGFTDCVVVGTGLSRVDDESLIDAAVRMPRIANCRRGPQDIEALEAGEPAKSGSYFRYWAGYVVVSRPVLGLAGTEGLRMVSGAALLATFIAAIVTIGRYTNWYTAVALFAPFALATNIMSTPTAGLSHALSNAAILLNVQLAAWGAARSLRLGVLLASVGAALFCYVDLLTTPAIPWAWSAFAVGVVRLYSSHGRARNFEMVCGVLLTGIAWPVAFAITWVSRWIIAASFLGLQPVQDVVFGKLEQRTTGTGVVDSLGFGSALIANLRYWWAEVPTTVLVFPLIVVVTLVGLLLALKNGGIDGLRTAFVLSLPALIVPIWFFVLAEHSQVHDHFAYRNVPVAFGIVMAACVTAAMSGYPRDRACAQHKLPAREVTTGDAASQQ